MPIQIIDRTKFEFLFGKKKFSKRSLNHVIFFVGSEFRKKNRKSFRLFVCFHFFQRQNRTFSYFFLSLSLYRQSRRTCFKSTQFCMKSSHRYEKQEKTFCSEPKKNRNSNKMSLLDYVKRKQGGHRGSKRTPLSRAILKQKWEKIILWGYRPKKWMPPRWHWQSNPYVKSDDLFDIGIYSWTSISFRLSLTRKLVEISSACKKNWFVLKQLST